MTCPDCGSKIGIILSVGKTGERARIVHDEEEEAPAASGNMADKLREAGVDISLLNIEEGEQATLISPKKFLGDLGGPINDSIRAMGGTWIREGRDSRWEIRKSPNS